MVLNGNNIGIKKYAFLNKKRNVTISHDSVLEGLAINHSEHRGHIEHGDCVLKICLLEI